METRESETVNERIRRMHESRYLLWQSMLKLGCYCKAHGELFKKIDAQLKADGCDLYSLDDKGDS